jgi:predicted 3-demethylubiquinone-9 3-methyltransferase (glyoxalase superfamily)
MQKIATCLWFDDQAEEAANFYTSIFKNSKIVHIARYGEAGPRPAGMVMTVTFQLDGRDFIALNGGPEFNFSEAISLYVGCQSQEEVDYFWEKLSEGGEQGPCGWLKYRYGLSWQIVPTALIDMLNDSDAAKANRVMESMLKMSRLDVQALQEAYGR